MQQEGAQHGKGRQHEGEGREEGGARCERYEMSCGVDSGCPSLLLPGCSNGLSSLLLSSRCCCSAVSAASREPCAAVGGRSGGTHPVGSRQCSETAREARRLIHRGAGWPVRREHSSLEKWLQFICSR